VLEILVKILSLVFPGFTFIDLVGPMQAFSLLPGAEFEYAWKERGPVSTDAGASVTATHTFADAASDVDILFVPGNTKALFATLNDRETLEFVADRGSRAGWVTSVCNGSLLLGCAGLLEGYQAASYWYSRDLLRNYGATPKADRVVIDRNRATGGGMTAGLDFGLTLLGHLAGQDIGRLAELLFEYAPAPPHGTGRPELADAETLGRATEILADLMPLSTAPRAPLVRAAKAVS
jgi:cyclohexyl-isocyanide hydratase